MFSSPIAALMATESTPPRAHRAAREVAPRRPRRAVALLLQRTAHRLDPYVTRAPRVTLGR